MFRSNYEAPDEMYRLRWDSSKQVVDLSNAFQSFRNDEELLDVSLVCSDSNGGSITTRAHKVILAAYSPVFRDMFNRITEKKDPAIFLKGVSHENLSSMLDFMYQGSVDIPKSVLNEFIADAEELQIKGLRGEGDDDYRNEKTRSAKANTKNIPYLKPDKTKSLNKYMKKESEDAQMDNFLSHDRSGFETLATESDGNNLKRARRPPKKKVKSEQQNDHSTLFADSEPTDGMADFSHPSLEKETTSKLNHSMDPNEKSRIEDMFEKIMDKWAGTESKKRTLFGCKLCSKEIRSDKRAQHLRSNHPN